MRLHEIARPTFYLATSTKQSVGDKISAQASIYLLGSLLDHRLEHSGYWGGDAIPELRYEPWEHRVLAVKIIAKANGTLIHPYFSDVVQRSRSGRAAAGRYDTSRARACARREH